jgi:hypothetical protein
MYMTIVVGQRLQSRFVSHHHKPGESFSCHVRMQLKRRGHSPVGRVPKGKQSRPKRLWAESDTPTSGQRDWRSGCLAQEEGSLIGDSSNFCVKLIQKRHHFHNVL